jgi:hypothetical protein
MLLAGCLVMALLTQAEFPYLFSSVAKLAPLGTAIVAVRNLLLIATAVTLARASPAPSRGLGGEEVCQPIVSGLA